MPTPLTPEQETALKTLGLEGQDDLVLYKELKAQAAKDGWGKTLAANAGKITQEITEDIAAIRAATPAIKSGYKTSEFWLFVLIPILNGLSMHYFNKPVDLDLNLVLGAGAAVYAFIRTWAKKSP